MPDKAVVTESNGAVIKTIVIAGQIEGHTLLPQGQKATRYEELIPQLVEIEESEKIGGLLIILNTVGGDVEAGLALSELIAGMKKPTVSLVLGGGTFDRHTACRISQAFVYRTERDHDSASCQNNRYGAQRSPDLRLYEQYAKTHNKLHLLALLHDSEAFQYPYARQRRAFN